MPQPWQDQVDKFCRQYLQLESMLDFPDGTFLREPDVQEALYSRLFADGALRYEPPARRKVKTLKELVSRIEDSIEDWDKHEVSEDLMNALSVVIATPLAPEISAAQTRFYVSYALPSLPQTAAGDTPWITLLENRLLLSAAGTTGRRTWEAALHLGQYLCENPSVVRGREVLELGAGTGYLSVLCARYLGASRVIASDGSDEVINNLPENLFLNDLQGSSSGVSLMDLKWGHALLGTEEAEWNGGRAVDVVLGADVTYDRSVIPALASTLAELFALHPRVEVYISAAHRNEVTFRAFLDRCRDERLDVCDLDFPVQPSAFQRGPFYSDEAPISVCRVSRLGRDRIEK